MNKLKLLIISEQNDFDKRLSNTIKKFSSERNLFFTNLYNNSINWNSNTNLNSDLNCSKIKNNNGKISSSSTSFFRGTLLKRCKSTKEIYNSTSSNYENKKLQTQSKYKNDFTEEYKRELNYNNNHNSNVMVVNEIGEDKYYRQSYNLDEFDKEYLYSDNRKNIVKELRKNFENDTNHKSLTAPSSSFQQQQKTSSADNGERSNRTSAPPPPPPRIIKSKPPICNGNNGVSGVGGGGNSVKKRVSTNLRNHQYHQQFSRCEFSVDDLEKHLTSTPPLSSSQQIPSVQSSIAKQHHYQQQQQQQRFLSRHSFYLHRNDENVYEVGDGCDDCNLVKQKARKLMEMFTKNHQQQHNKYQYQHHQQQSTKKLKTTASTTATNCNNSNSNNEWIQDEMQPSRKNGNDENADTDEMKNANDGTKMKNEKLKNYCKHNNSNNNNHSNNENEITNKMININEANENNSYNCNNNINHLHNNNNNDINAQLYHVITNTRDHHHHHHPKDQQQQQQLQNFNNNCDYNDNDRDDHDNKNTTTTTTTTIINNNNNSTNNYNHNNQNDIRRNDNSNIKSNLNEIFITKRNNLLNIQHNNNNNNNQYNNKRRSLNAAIARDNNLYRNILSDSYEDSKYGIKKSGSVNKIDLEILKSELDDYVDPKWCNNMNLGYGFRSQRTLKIGGGVGVGGKILGGSSTNLNRKELDLEQKIDLEIKMREGSAKLLAACNNSRNSSHHHGNSGISVVSSVLNGGGSSNCGSTNSHNTQILEAAKNLLTSNERMTAYMAELQRRKRTADKDSSSNLHEKSIKPSGKVSLSEIRMPLMWRDTDHFKNKGDHRRFAVFCLAKIGTEIYDTSLLSPVDRNLTDVCFNDAILFTNIAPDFELKLEVYAVMMESDLSIASTPKKIKNTIHSSISRTVGRRLAANLKDELNNTKIGPKFELIATAHLTLSDASESTHTHDLCLTPNNGTIVNANNKLPLFGHFCCRLAVQPDFYEQPTQTGLLCLIPMLGPARLIDGYARLQAFRIDIWDDEKVFELNYRPIRCIPVTRDSKVKLKGETDIILTNLEEGTIEEYIIRPKTGNDAQKWYSSLKKSIKEHNLWEHVVLSPEPMQLAIPGNSKNYFLRSSRQGSLYDQVPILDSTTESRQQQSLRPSVQDIFAIPISGNGNNGSNGGSGGVGGNGVCDTSPSFNDFRTRAYSSSRSSSHSSSTLSAGSSIGSINSTRKSHWPFGGK